MRSLATLLVLLLAPGLVLPAGFMLRICRCATASRQAASTAGCCSAQVAKAQASAPTCCQHGCCSKEERSDTGPARMTPRCCNCVWVTVPEHPPSLLQQGPTCDDEALPPSTVVAIPALLDTGHALRPVAVARPPPRDQHRNLPLLL